jgi:hypothetical protein
MLMSPRHDLIRMRGARLAMQFGTLLVSLPVVWPGCDLEQRLDAWSPPMVDFYKIAATHYLFGALLLLACLVVLRLQGARRRRSVAMQSTSPGQGWSSGPQTDLASVEAAQLGGKLNGVLKLLLPRDSGDAPLARTPPVITDAT